MLPKSQSLRILSAAMLIAAVSLISACSVLTPPPPTPPDTLGEPPPATLIIGDQSQLAGIGTYCWPGIIGQVAVCADLLGIPTPLEPLTTPPDVVAVFELPLDEPPSEASLLVMPVTPEEEMDTSVPGLRFWPPLPGESFQLPSDTKPEVSLSLEPGLYVLSLFVRWDDVGDVSYGFLVEVEAN